MLYRDNDDAVADVNDEFPDKKSIMMYLMCCYEVLAANKRNVCVRIAWNIILEIKLSDLAAILAVLSMESENLVSLSVLFLWRILCCILGLPIITTHSLLANI